MSAITLEGPVVEQLRAASSRTSLCDPTGQPIGYVISTADYIKLQYADARQRYTDADIEEMRRRPPEGISTDELIKRLKKKWATKQSGATAPSGNLISTN